MAAQTHWPNVLCCPSGLTLKVVEKKVQSQTHRWEPEFMSSRSERVQVSQKTKAGRQKGSNVVRQKALIHRDRLAGSRVDLDSKRYECHD